MKFRILGFLTASSIATAAAGAAMGMPPFLAVSSICLLGAAAIVMFPQSTSAAPIPVDAAEDYSAMSEVQLRDRLRTDLVSPVPNRVSESFRGRRIVPAHDTDELAFLRERLRILDAVESDEGRTKKFNWIRPLDRSLWYAIEGMGENRVYPEGIALTVARSDRTRSLKDTVTAALEVLRPKPEPVVIAPAPEVMKLIEDDFEFSIEELERETT